MLSSTKLNWFSVDSNKLIAYVFSNLKLNTRCVPDGLSNHNAQSITD
jgi:hypothetical protein